MRFLQCCYPNIAKRSLQYMGKSRLLPHQAAKHAPKELPNRRAIRRLSSEFSHVIFRGLKAEMPRFAARFSCGDIVRNASRFAIYDLQYNAQNKINEHHIANNCGNTCVFHRYTITFAATTSRNASRVRRSGGAFQPIAVYLLTSEQCALYAVMLNT